MVHPNLYIAWLGLNRGFQKLYIEKSLKRIVGRLIKYRAEDIPISRRVCMALRAEYTL